MEKEINKPKVKLVGTDGNVFALLGKCTSALKRNGQYDQAKELTEKVFKTENYHSALVLMMEYVDVE